MPERVAEIFDAAGVLSARLPGYRPRAGQLQMANAVARVMEHGGRLVVEAGTGVGKTYAYLVPALLSGKRILLSTASKALQDQLYGRDIPQLGALLGLPIRVAMLKGRSSYVCQLRLGTARHVFGAERSAAVATLAEIERWAQATHTGDLAEVRALDDNSLLIPLVTSSRENCLGSSCAHAATCFVNQARRQALAADVVVINHHLFFADLTIRESGVAELLPVADCVVFDEAHQLNEIGVQFLGSQISASQLAAFARDLFDRASALAGGYARWDLLAQAISDSATSLAARFPASEVVQRADWSVLGSGGQTQLLAMHGAMQAAQLALDALAAMSPELQLLAARAQDLAQRLQAFAQPLPLNAVRWLELGRQWRMLQAPLDIADAMQNRVTPASAITAGKAWIFTSATLGHDARMAWFVDSCGLADAECVQVPSPFDYARQSALFIPTHFAAPSDPDHSQQVAELAARGARILGGRTLVLTTSLRAMRSIGEALRASRTGSDALQVLVQGESPKRELLERFSTAGACAVLVASAGFWEGIDIPGEALQLLVIDKLPFAPPDDPVQQARAKRLEGSGRNAFTALQLPQAAVALKQGAGRLIRRENDQGVLVVCDVRLRQKGYGTRLLAALPPMLRLETLQDFDQRLRSITTTSTTAAPLYEGP